VPKWSQKGARSDPRNYEISKKNIQKHTKINTYKSRQTSADQVAPKPHKPVLAREREARLREESLPNIVATVA
jgi:hypothetical protein